MEEGVKEMVKDHYSNGPVHPKKIWDSNAVRPLSDDPKDTGLYVVTTYDTFFRLELEKSRNGGPPKP